ncbi:MAG: nucleoside deaminase [Bryobacteraceae bacterium]
MPPSHNDFLQRAVALALDNVGAGGGPFGALIVRDGQVIAEGVNRVTQVNDPTAHAEIVAIREACRALNRFQLDNCAIYASCEPCPMCLGAIYWARLGAVYFAATREDAASAGFDDSLIYSEMPLDPGERKIAMRRVALPGSTAPFLAWARHAGRIPY